MLRRLAANGPARGRREAAMRAYLERIERSPRRALPALPAARWSTTTASAAALHNLTSAGAAAAGGEEAQGLGECAPSPAKAAPESRRGRAPALDWQRR